jgi:POT family proton-dependent oligopeptide transporter
MHPPSENPLAPQRHPPGLYVLFFTEMWERFSFYTMMSMLTLYLQDPEQGFGWSEADATRLYSNYNMFVYASPLIGGWLADRALGYRRAVMIGGLFFMAGHILLAFRSLEIVYAALTFLVIGNGFFKPNVSTMVGRLYAEESPLKDRAYNIFYMGINVGAFLSPIVAEKMRARFGFHPAFAVAAFGMLISILTLWCFRRYVGNGSGREPNEPPRTDDVGRAQEPSPIDAVPAWKRIGALQVIFAVVIGFWMVFNQGGSTLTYWADKNTDWNVSGIISNSINPFWVITLTFPLVWFWKWLHERGMEPSTPTKMAIGMSLAGLAFLILYYAATVGEAGTTAGDQYKVSPAWLIAFYAVLTLGELMLSPMGLSLVSKVAPVKSRGLMMGGWFVATAIGNKLMVIGVYWEHWRHSTYFAVMAGIAFGMSCLLFLLLHPLKKAMPGV